MNGEQYLGNDGAKEVHDLNIERSACRIDEIIREGHDRPFSLLTEAHAEGYENCRYCIGRSTR